MGKEPHAVLLLVPPLGTRPRAPKPHTRPGQEAHVIRGTPRAKVCAEKDHSHSPLGSSSYQSIVKLCGNKLLNGKDCLQLSLQSTIKFPKSFYSAVSLE